MEGRNKTCKGLRDRLIEVEHKGIEYGQYVIYLN